MARLLHKRSNVKDRIPTKDILDYGELAINYNAQSPKIYLKNSNNKIISFIDEENVKVLIDEKQEEAISQLSIEIYDLINENELTTAKALSNLNDLINEIKKGQNNNITVKDGILIIDKPIQNNTLEI